MVAKSDLNYSCNIRTATVSSGYFNAGFLQIEILMVDQLNIQYKNCFIKSLQAQIGSK